MGEAPGKGSGKRHPPFTSEQAAEYGARPKKPRDPEKAETLREKLRLRKEALGIPDKEKPLNKAEIELLAKEHSPTALHTLISVASDPDDKRAVTAAQALLDRAYGKARESVDISGAEGGPLNLSVEFVKAVAKGGDEG